MYADYGNGSYSPESLSLFKPQRFRCLDKKRTRPFRTELLLDACIEHQLEQSSATVLALELW